MLRRASWMIVACLMALAACDSEDEVEPRGTATAQEEGARDNDCIIELFCHPEEFVCVISLDPCVGIDYVGICDGEEVIWCENDRLKGKNCAEAEPEKECGFNPATGLFDCLEPEEE